MNENLPHLLIVEAPYYQHIAEYLFEGAVFALDGKATFERIKVFGALEIPVAIKFYSQTQRYDGFIALGCVIRGETSHYDIVSEQSSRALMDLGMFHDLVVGNGILTVENEAQALRRARMDDLNKGGDAAMACLNLIEHKQLRYQPQFSPL